MVPAEYNRRITVDVIVIYIDSQKIDEVSAEG